VRLLYKTTQVLDIAQDTMAANGTSSFDFSAKNLPQKLFINNEYVDSKSGKFLTVFNPKDESLVSDKIPLANEHDVDAAVDAAEAALPAWKKITAAQRRDILLKFADLLVKYTEPLAELTRITLGAPFGAFGAFEVGLAAEAFKYNAGWCDKFLGEAVPQENGFMQIVSLLRVIIVVKAFCSA
jgi:aldehyde dehydrogenase (NAD+)